MSASVVGSLIDLEWHLVFESLIGVLDLGSRYPFIGHISECRPSASLEPFLRCVLGILAGKEPGNTFLTWNPQVAHGPF